MDKLTNTFINNAGKATQKQEVFYDAFKPKRYHQGDELNINPFTQAQWKAIYIIISVVSSIGFIIAFGG